MTALPGQHLPTADPSVTGRPADEDLRTLFGKSIAVFAALAGPTHVVEAANPAFFTAIGEERARTGVALAELMPELDGQGFIALLDEVYRTGESYTGHDARIMLGTGSQAREAFFDFTYEARRDADGTVTGIRVIGVETTQVKHAQRLMAEHRAMLEQIARQAPLAEVLDGMARCIENLAPQEVLVSVLLADADGLHLRHGAAPSLPDFYNQAIDGIATGEGVGSPAPGPPTTSWHGWCGRNGNYGPRRNSVPPRRRNSPPGCAPPQPRRPPLPAPNGVSSAAATAARHPPRSRSLTRGVTRRGAARSTSRRQSSTCVRSSSPTRNWAAWPPT
ncbi:PAS domain-containing protein [Micromonospora aurantiaca (nom. illeg.)]